MQIFLPEKSFTESAKVLDQKRLVKQLLEGRQILTVLAGESPSGAWRNHPAVKMFAGHEFTLMNYLAEIRKEMSNRGYKWQNNWDVIQDTYKRNFKGVTSKDPEWMQNGITLFKVNTTHRGRLWQKDPIHYEQYYDDGQIFMQYVCCPDKCTYYWATHKENV